MPAAGYTKTRCRGVLAPERLYTREGCLRDGGIGQKMLMEAKRSGIVRGIPVGVRVYYRGAELIAWIESHSK